VYQSSCDSAQGERGGDDSDRMVGDRWFPRQAPDPQRRTIQRAIAAAAQWDRTAHRIATEDPAALHVCGVDAALEDAHLVAAAVCVRDGQVCERAIARRRLRFPYIPGMLAFREGAAMAAAVGAIDGPIDCLIVDGNGRIHPRQAGTAVHLGVASGLPTIGVAKRLLCGRPLGALRGRPARTCTPIVADATVEAEPGRVIGMAVQTRQYPTVPRIQPVYVSPGHRMTVATAAQLITTLADGTRSPPPIREADAAATAARR
jgi:Deoxyinosine 3''endonuclease (endonuclease V)